jgi:spermidine/putrescine transport system permease protein
VVAHSNADQADQVLPRVGVKRRDQAAMALQVLFLILVAVILFGPLILLALFSFNDSHALNLPITGFTTRWYTDAIENERLREAIGNSVKISIIVMPACLVLGTAAAFIGGFIALPLVIPWLLTGVGALLFFNALNISLSLLTVGIMHTVVAFPLVAALVAAQLYRIDPPLEEASHDLGATHLQTLRFVILPLLIPTLAASAVFVFIWSFNNFIISFFAIGFDNTFPIWVFSSLRRSGNVPVINAISTLVSVVQIALVWAAWRYLRFRSAQRGQDVREVIAGGTTA